MSEEKIAPLHLCIDKQQKIIDQLQDHVHVLTAKLARASEDDKIMLSFEMSPTERFRFSCSPPSLDDPDVRDALAKGRALLEGFVSRTKRKLEQRD